MTDTDQNDRQVMQAALTLARQTTALASPNPQVGCVLTQPSFGGLRIIGQGAHLYASRDHAEVVALTDARVNGHRTAGATAYVTLEPCSHHGRTPPCADALIAAEVTRVVIATLDPNPLVAGKGIARLRAAGIDVQVGTLEAEARTLNDGWAFSILHRRPFVTLKAALSVDGYLAPPPHSRSADAAPVWLTGSAARVHVQHLRHTADAILTGIGTVLADNPYLTDRTALPRRRPLLRVVLDPLARTPLTSNVVQTAVSSDLLVLTSMEAPTDRVLALQSAGAELHTIPTLADDTAAHRRPRLDLRAVLNLLNDRLSPDHTGAEPIRSLLLEAGSALNGAFLTADLVDQLVLFFAQTELGPGSVPFALGIASPFLLEQHLTPMTRRQFVSAHHQDALLTGYLHDPWSPV